MNRILEHGLHMWMGYYEVAFATIRRCYQEWKKSPDNPSAATSLACCVHTPPEFTNT